MQPYLWSFFQQNTLQISKVGCVFLMVVVSLLPNAEFGRNDHREDAPHFINFERRYRYFSKNKLSHWNQLVCCIPYAEHKWPLQFHHGKYSRWERLHQGRSKRCTNLGINQPTMIEPPCRAGFLGPKPVGHRPSGWVLVLGIERTRTSKIQKSRTRPS